MPWSAWTNDVDPATGQAYVYSGLAQQPAEWKYSHKVWSKPGPNATAPGIPGWYDHSFAVADIGTSDVAAVAQQQLLDLYGGFYTHPDWGTKGSDGVYRDVPNPVPPPAMGLPVAGNAGFWTWNLGPGHGDYGQPAANVGFNPYAAFTPTAVWRQFTVKQAGSPQRIYSEVSQVENTAIGLYADLAWDLVSTSPTSVLRHHDADLRVPIQYESTQAVMQGWSDVNTYLHWQVEWADGDYSTSGTWQSSTMPPPNYVLSIRAVTAPPLGQQLPDWFPQQSGAQAAVSVANLTERGWSNDGARDAGDQQLHWDEPVTIDLSGFTASSLLLQFLGGYWGGGTVPPFTNYPTPTDPNVDRHQQNIGFQVFTTYPGTNGLYFPDVHYTYKLPRYRYWIGEEPHLRLTQRTDGHGIVRHPRLAASSGGTPMSVQHNPTARLGPNNRPR